MEFIKRLTLLACLLCLFTLWAAQASGLTPLRATVLTIPGRLGTPGRNRCLSTQ